jgi:hypothetical protein
MEPRIQYAQTTDGVSIAYYTLGEGAPLVMTPSFVLGHPPGERCGVPKLRCLRRDVASLANATP